jgi:molybdenum cofactor cytidylyltransferase
VASILDLQQGEALEETHLAAILCHPEGSLKGVPQGTTVRALINGVDNDSLRVSAQRIAGSALQEPAIQSILLGTLAEADPICEVWVRTGIVVLGAGGSQRFGKPKMLIDWQGKPLLRQVVEMCLESEVGPIHVVVGADYEVVRTKVDDLPVKILENRDWRSGQSSSVRLGVSAIQGHCEAVIFVLGDMPLVKPQVLKGLAQMHRENLAPIVAPHASDRFGNPVLFDRLTFSDLMSLEGDQGGRALFGLYPPQAYLADEGVLFDIDVPEDLE